MALPATMAGQGNVTEIMLNILTHTHKDYCNDFKHTQAHTHITNRQTHMQRHRNLLMYEVENIQHLFCYFSFLNPPNLGL